MGSSPIFQNEKDATPRTKFAVKIIRARDLEYQKVALREYSLLKTLNHPGIIKMVDAYVNNARETIYLVMNLVEGQSLTGFVDNYVRMQEVSTCGGLPERMCKSIVLQVL